MKNFYIVMLFCTCFIVFMNINNVYAADDLSNQNINNVDEVTTEEFLSLVVPKIVEF